ncbi:MAG TPA: methyltransferase domain-containing protein [Solirubrobacteraceae bacterium]|jgi:SAM-dependent methyltransferase
MADWGVGEYEVTARRLEPAADEAVRALGSERGDRIVDVGCGTGNAALVAARLGATALGVDTAPRLVEVARERAAAEGLDATFAVGDALALPAEDGEFDGAVSVFGVIFAEPEAAARELLRVVRPGGRIVVTTWTTDGATPRAIAAMTEALGAPPQKPRWSDPEFVRSLFAPHGVEIEIASLAFEAESAAAYVAEHAETHPMWLAAAPRLRELSRYDEVVAKATAIFDEANEDPSGFRITSRYHVVKVAR